MKTFLVVMLFALVFAGCSTPSNESTTPGCRFAYDESYECYKGKPYSLEPIYETKKAQECSEFARALGEGVFWLEGTDESGEKFARKEVVGENGWRFDGVVRSNIIYIAGSSSWIHTVCRLESVTSELIQGVCGAYYFPKEECRSADSFQECLQELQCLERNCSFTFPIGDSQGTAISESVKCLLPYPDERHDTVAVSVSDSVVSISIPNLTVTWTKRPGL